MNNIKLFWMLFVSIHLLYSQEKNSFKFHVELAEYFEATSKFPTELKYEDKGDNTPVVKRDLQEENFVEVYGQEIYNTFARRTDGAYLSNSNYDVLKVDIEGIDSPLLASTRTNGTGTAVAVFFDENENLIGNQIQGTTTTVIYSRVLLNIPPGTKYVAISYYKNGQGYYHDFKLEKIVTDFPSITDLKSLNQWRGKKVLGLGTSVMFGRRATKSYMFEASKRLGFNYINTSVAGQAIHAQDDGLGGIEILNFGSSVLSIAEYSSLGVNIENSPLEPLKPNGPYNNHYRTWENIFKPENKADLYVFAILPNNIDFATTDWDDFNKATWTYNTGTFEDHRKTFLGALIYMFNKMYESNPEARAVFVLDSEFSYAEGRKELEKFANEFGIEIIDLWKKLQFNPKTKSLIYSEGGTNAHPSTFSHILMGEMLANELLLIR